MLLLLLLRNEQETAGIPATLVAAKRPAAAMTTTTTTTTTRNDDATTKIPQARCLPTFRRKCESVEQNGFRKFWVFLRKIDADEHENVQFIITKSELEKLLGKNRANCEQKAASVLLLVSGAAKHLPTWSFSRTSSPASWQIVVPHYKSSVARVLHSKQGFNICAFKH